MLKTFISLPQVDHGHQVDLRKFLGHYFPKLILTVYI